MILKGSQRGGGSQLAAHLLNTLDNDHITIHELRGFISDNIHGAFKEAYAISRGTRCKQFLFSLSLSPPETESVSVDVFEKAISCVEKKMGLVDQPRAIVFHEKEGRRHAHCVWSRINIGEMKALNLPHFKLKLRDISKQLYLENRWQMPTGFVDSKERNPLNFTLSEWQQAKRIKFDPRTIKKAFQDCWAISDSKSSFESALKERGYYLSQGDRRGFVAVDWYGEVYAVTRYIGIKNKEVRAKIGDPSDLPTVEICKNEIGKLLSNRFRRFVDEVSSKHAHSLENMQRKRDALVRHQRLEREQLSEKQRKRWIAETRVRSEKLPRGLKAIWFRMTGKYRAILKENEAENLAATQYDQQEEQVLIDRQLTSLQILRNEIKSVQKRWTNELVKLDHEIQTYQTNDIRIDDNELKKHLRPRLRI